MNKYKLLILAVPLFFLAGCANNQSADNQNPVDSSAQVQTDKVVPGQPYSNGPTAPPSAKGPTALPQPQAVTKDENIHLTLPLKTEN